MTRARVAFDIPETALIDELFSPNALARLRSEADIVEARSASVLITGWGSVTLTSDELERRPELRVVVHAAGTVKRLVTPAVWDRGIRVSSCAGANSLPVAEYTLGAILLGAKDVFESARRYRLTGDMNAARPGAAAGAYDITVGIVGASRIGRRLVELLAPFDIDICIYDPSVELPVGGRVRQTSLDELLESSDVVSLHAPSLPETYRMIAAPELARMRDGALLVNTARGALVDTDALTAEVAAGRLRAVLDVTDPEPLPVDHPLFSLAGATVTPHIAGSLGNELRRLGEQVVDEVVSFVRTGTLRHEVTRAELPLLA